jgi:SAM-dependent methyltransferase
VKESGARRIFFYNWPTYAGTWAAAAVAIAGGLAYTTVLAPVLVVAGVVALLWSAASLVVSAYVYDRSELPGGGWLPGLLPARVERWITVDAGLDAEVDVDRAMPGTCVARFDVYDRARLETPSVERARRRTARTHPATPASVTSLPLANGSCDAVLVVFTAHELRDQTLREAAFAELGRLLSAEGRLIVVEHLRDAANFAAFGPGFLHFQSRAEWLRLADVTGLRVAVERRVTPWVMALALERA